MTFPRNRMEAYLQAPRRRSIDCVLDDLLTDSTELAEEVDALERFGDGVDEPTQKRINEVRQYLGLLTAPPAPRIRFSAGDALVIGFALFGYVLATLATIRLWRM